jgi:SEC-C motif-containing protein
MKSAGWTDIGSDGTYRYGAAALSVFWTESEYQKLVARWPSVSVHVGATWDEHRQRTEQYCALADRNALRIKQFSGNVAGLETFLAAAGIDVPSEDDLLSYPDMRTVSSPMPLWPPARTAPCWCGSGRKYKQCCRPHGLGTLE